MSYQYTSGPPSEYPYSLPAQSVPPPIPGNRPGYNPSYQAPPNAPLQHYPPPPGNHPPSPYPYPPFPPPGQQPPQPQQQLQQQPLFSFPQGGALSPAPAPPLIPHQPPQAYPGYSQYPVKQYSEPIWYLGVIIPDPFRNPTQYNQHGVPGYNPTADTEAIRKATKGFGTDDAALISTLVPVSAIQIDAVSQCFVSKYGKEMLEVLDSETSGWFGMGILGLATGPLGWDAELVHQAVAGVGTKENLLTELIFGRPNSEINLLKVAYRHKFNRDLVEDIKGDLSSKTERMFIMALSANRPLDTVPVNYADVTKDVQALYKAGQGKVGTDEMAFCDILINRSQPHLTALIGEYNKKHKSLSKVIKSEFSGHMRAALLHIVNGAKPKRDGQGVWRDAKLIDDAMAGFGTKDMQLVWRLVRAHWDPKRMEAIKGAYLQRTKKNLEARIASETSGSYKKLMVALVKIPVRSV